MTIVAAQNAKQRQRLIEKQRVYNKDRRSAVATRMKKVLSFSRALEDLILRLCMLRQNEISAKESAVCGSSV